MTLAASILRTAVALSVLVACSSPENQRPPSPSESGPAPQSSAAPKSVRPKPDALRSESGSIRTHLVGASCRQQVDKDDPNETPYLECPGVAGYALVVRHVDSGRNSIDVLDAARRVFPLKYDEVITRHMMSLDKEAEWRVAMKDGKQIPIALIVRVQAREDIADPERVTRSFFAIAKITPKEVCVTDRIPEGAQSLERVRGAADSASGRKCLSPQP